MRRGKIICEILKSIRNQIAIDNGIDYKAKECHHKGDCSGTCPQCDAELKYIQEKLNEKECRGEKIHFNAHIYSSLMFPDTSSIYMTRFIKKFFIYDKENVSIAESTISDDVISDD